MSWTFFDRSIPFSDIDVQKNQAATVAKRVALTSLHASNIGAGAALQYLKVYDKASAAAEGTDTPVLTFVLPVDFNGPLAIPANGIQFNAGIAISASEALTGAAGTTPGANEVIVNGSYRTLANA